jgi:cytochrome c biogenesis protein CcmG, thiol:disulfide interchange protein DsbE
MKSMRTLAGLAACIVVVAFLFANPWTHATLRKMAYAAGILHPVPPLRTGVAFPPLSIEQLNGERSRWNGSQIPGTVVYNVFTSWCPSCRDEAPAFAQAAPLLRKRGIAVVGIDQGEPPAAVERFAGAFGIRYPMIIDPDSSTTAVLSARVIPETIVVHDGIVRDIAVGPVSPAFLAHLAQGV